MSEENVEVVRRVTEVMDAEGFEAALPLFLEAAHPDVEWREDPAWPGFAVYQGVEEVQRVIFDRMETLDFDQQTEDLIAVDDKVVAPVRWLGRGKTSGAQGEMSMVMVWTIRDRAITKLEFFLDRARAFDSVGLSEQAVTRGNVEVVLRQYADTNARDFAAAMDAYAEDVTLISHWGAGLLSPTATGKAAVGEWFGDWFSQFGSDYRFDIEDARGAGNRVFLLASHHGHGRGSGAPIEHRLAYAYTVRLGKVQHVELWAADHAGRKAARAAVGLSE